MFKVLPTCPKMFPLSPFSKAMDWNFSPWTRLRPLYTILCPFPGLEIGRTVPSMKPKQLFRDPFLQNTVEEQLSLVHLYSTLLRDDSDCHK